MTGCDLGRLTGGVGAARLDQPPVTLMWRDTAGPLMAAVDDEIMPLGLARDGLVDRGMEQVVAFGGAQRRAQIGGVFLAEAHDTACRCR